MREIGATPVIAADCEVVIEASFLFEREWYLKTYADVATSGVDPVRHYLLHGADEGRNPNRIFDTRWYLSTYPEVAAQGHNPLLHYIREGAGRGFHPSNEFPSHLFAAQHTGLTPLGRFFQLEQAIVASCLFDRNWYAETYAVAATEDPLWDYLFHGLAEGRNPNRLFDSRWYVSVYPEVAADREEPLTHYIRLGATRGYSTHPAFPFALFPGKRTGGYTTGLTPLGEFLRSLNLLERSPLFERDWYLDRYKDVAASGGDPLWHYLLHGVAEGRNPNPLFDTRWYLSAYPEVSDEGRNPLGHYILEGAARGYDPHPFFPKEAHNRAHTSEAAAGTSALEDFLFRVARQDSDAFPRFTAYDVHRATQANHGRRARSALVQHIEVMSQTPKFIVLIDGPDGAPVDRTRDNLGRQIYDRVRTVRTQAEALAMIRASDCAGDYFLWIDAGDELDSDALYALAARVNAEPDCDLIYFDHDVATDDGLSRPLHKPAWSPDYLEGSDYIGPAACFSLAKTAGPLTHAEGRYDFALRFTEASLQITHLDRVLLHRPAHRGFVTPEQEAAEVRALAGRLGRTNRTGTVRATAAGSGSYEIDIALRETPLVSIVIPTAGRIINYKDRSVDLIVDCLEAIITRSTYKNLEFIIVDNGDFDRSRLAHLTPQKLVFVTYALPDVNIARKINLGAAHATGSVILILNDDVVALTPDWIERMLAHLEKPHVGAVGAKLLYPDNTIQHVGVVACDGHPEHVRRGWPRDDVGYAFSTAGVRNYLAVTGAASMARLEDFRRVSGYSEEFPMDYNDIDFCYKLADAGFYVVYEPRAELYHYESASAIKPPNTQDAGRFARKWARLESDPFYNEYCFSKHPATYEISYTERKH